jgi:hypothetical protein
MPGRGSSGELIGRRDSTGDHGGRGGRGGEAENGSPAVSATVLTHVISMA